MWRKILQNSVTEVVSSQQNMTSSISAARQHHDDYHCMKLTSFDKLLQVKYSLGMVMFSMNCLIWSYISAFRILACWGVSNSGFSLYTGDLRLTSECEAIWTIGCKIQRTWIRKWNCSWCWVCILQSFYFGLVLFCRFTPWYKMKRGVERYLSRNDCRFIHCLAEAVMQLVCNP